MWLTELADRPTTTVPRWIWDGCRDVQTMGRRGGCPPTANAVSAGTRWAAPLTVTVAAFPGDPSANLIPQITVAFAAAAVLPVVCAVPRRSVPPRRRDGNASDRRIDLTGLEQPRGLSAANGCRAIGRGAAADRHRPASSRSTTRSGTQAGTTSSIRSARDRADVRVPGRGPRQPRGRVRC